MGLRRISLSLWALAFCLGAMAHAAEPPSFRYDVMPVLTKAGCNMGACHGAQTGKGELRLSLRGESPLADYEILAGKWINRDAPEKSLILSKPLGSIPHEGGQRFAEGSEMHDILLKWMQAGAPMDAPDTAELVSLEVTPPEAVLFEPATSTKLQVTATWADGTKRDVTRWAIYEPSNLVVEVDAEGQVERTKPGETTIGVRYLGQQKPVRLMFVAAKPGFQWAEPTPANFIDERIFAKLELIRANPSPIVDDSTFVRRAYLDLNGMIPSADEARDFVADQDPGKRAKLIDVLLERPEFADFWALKWADLLRVEEKLLDTNGVAAFHAFIRESFANNVPLDEFARQILTARGSTYDNGAANYYRALRSPTARSEATAQVFLGVRLNCAQCHNHPFEHWTQDDYYQFAAVFDGMDYRIIENKRRDKSDKSQFIGEQVVLVNLPKTFKDPRTKDRPLPRLLGQNAPPLDPQEDRFEALADWFTSRDNGRFAEVQINRIWFHLMGQGLVDPVDDFRATNPASHPDLLAELADRFVASGYDLRAAIRLITASRAYQTASEPNPTNEGDDLNYAHARVRRLSAEQLLDSAHLALGLPAQFNGFDKDLRAAQLPGVNQVYRDSHPSYGDRFLKLFGKPPRLTNSDSERSNETSLAQVFELVSGDTLDTLLAAEDNRLGQLLGSPWPEPEVIKELYWSILSRPPSRIELETLLDHVVNAQSPRQGYEDVAWSLLNAKEFLLRR